MTANEFTNVKDVRDIYLYTKDGYLLTFLRVFYININLLSEQEKQAKCQALTASFENDRKDFSYFTLPREIDLDRYTQELKNLYNSEMVNLGRRHLLAEILSEASKLVMSGENYEHQHYIKLWASIGSDRGNAENEIRNRTLEFKSRYESAGIHTEILKEAEILKLCNLFGNATQAAYEQETNNMFFEMITNIR